MLTSGFAWRSVLFCAAICTLSSIPQLPSLSGSGTHPGQGVVASCANCHGTQGVAVGNSLPAQAGQSKPDVLLALQSNKNATRANTVMPQLAKAYAGQ